jgi:hypothetical protein
MNKRLITLFLSLLVAIVVVVLVVDLSSSKIDNRQANPYEFNVDEFEKVDSGLVHYRESKQIRIDSENPLGIAYHQGLIYLLQDSLLKIINLDGHLKNMLDLNDEARTLTVSEDGKVLIAFKNYIQFYNDYFNLLLESEKENDTTIFTSIAHSNSSIFVADAGNRRVIIFDETGRKKTEIGGQTEKDSKHGFIVPSAYFDLATNNDELWVVNPGKHQFQQYTLDGRLLGFWEKTSLKIDGFSGCCNPSHFCFLPNGDFVTSEKGIIRIKVHSPSGELKSVIAPPSKFPNGIHAPDVCADEGGNIIALDFDLKMIRIFTLR